MLPYTGIQHQKHPCLFSSTTLCTPGFPLEVLVAPRLGLGVTLLRGCMCGRHEGSRRFLFFFPEFFQSPWFIGRANKGQLNSPPSNVFRAFLHNESSWGQEAITQVSKGTATKEASPCSAQRATGAPSARPEMLPGPGRKRTSLCESRPLPPF